MKQFSFINLSKENLSSPRRARKQLLFEALQRQPCVKEIVYINPYYHRWRSRENDTPNNSAMRVLQGKFLLPGERFAWVRAINRFFAHRMLRKEMAYSVPWYTIFYDPWDVPLARRLKKSGEVFFDWTEDWSAYYENRTIGAAQNSAVKMASGVLVVSEKLEKRAIELRGSEQDVLLLPNATTWDPIDSVSSPEDMSQIPFPRLGYLGHLGPWFDTDLVIDLARKRPQWNWVMVGPIDESKHELLRRLENVHLMGQKPFDELQSYMAQCQVLIAPYHKRLDGDATKLYDYLTLGHPIISSEIGTAIRLQPYVRTAMTMQSWLIAIEEALQENNASLRLARQGESLRHTWNVRAETLLTWLSAFREDQYSRGFSIK